MIAISPLDDLARRLVDLVPSEAREHLTTPTREALDDVSANFKDTLLSGLRRLDLVTREEFDVQRCVLLRTREMVEALEHRVTELETLLGNKGAPH